jgi:hypothetical protein
MRIVRWPWLREWAGPQSNALALKGKETGYEA